MPRVAAFYTLNEQKKPEERRVYHNNSACGPANEIPSTDRWPGDGGYRLCNDCDRLNKAGK
jgi:hypothetical protein